MAAVTADPPWTVIKAADKKRARPNPMRHMLDRLPHANKDVARPPDMLLVGGAHVIHERGERQNCPLL